MTTVTFSGPENRGTNMTIGDRTFRIWSYWSMMSNAGLWLVSGMIRALVFDKPFEIKYDLDESDYDPQSPTSFRIVSNTETSVTNKGITETFPVSREELGHALVRDIAPYAQDWVVRNLRFKKDHLSAEDYAAYAAGFKDKEDDLLEQILYLQEILEQRPIGHTQEELDFYVDNYRRVWTERMNMVF